MAYAISNLIHSQPPSRSPPHTHPSYRLPMVKQMVFEADARASLQRGVEKLAKAVATTLGPRGRNAVLDKGWGAPTITKDGVTVAEEIQLKNKYEQIGAQLVKEVASKTSDIAGDGTTTATVLTEAIFSHGLRAITAGAAPARLLAAIKDGSAAITERLTGMARKVETNEEIAQVATISANNDPITGALIADAMEKVGKDGVITVEDGKTLETVVDIVEGMQFDRGFLSPHFATDTNAMETVYENPLILVHETRISNVQKLVPILEICKQANKPLLIIAEDIESEALATLVVNKLRGVLNVCAVKAPGYGERRKAMLEDIAAMTGATAIMKDLGKEIDQVTLEELGTANRVVIDTDATTIVGGSGNREKIDGRVNQIRQQVEGTSSDYDREKLQERLAKLIGGVAVIEVGAATEVEMKEKKARVEDALNATRAAVEEGVVPGGGTALLRCLSCLDELDAKGDRAFGVQIVRDAIQDPIKVIASNAGVEGALVVNRVLAGEGNFGYNAATEVYGDMLEMGVIDPTKVVRAGLQNAASVASLLLTTEAVRTRPHTPASKALVREGALLPAAKIFAMARSFVAKA